ncbi:hypothetical protein [Sphingorhabdus sp. M41]
MANTQLDNQQTTHDRCHNLQQTMLIIATELQRTNTAPINAIRVGQAK